MKEVVKVVVVPQMEEQPSALVSLVVQLLLREGVQEEEEDRLLRALRLLLLPSHIRRLILLRRQLLEHQQLLQMAWQLLQLHMLLRWQLVEPHRDGQPTWASWEAVWPWLLTWLQLLALVVPEEEVLLQEVEQLCPLTAPLPSWSTRQLTMVLQPWLRQQLQLQLPITMAPT